MKVLIILIFLLLIGCDNIQPVCDPVTTVINKTVIKPIYINRTCPAPTVCATCPECKPTECKTDTAVLSVCTNRLSLCNIRMDTMNDHLYDCLLSNTTQYSDNLTSEYGRCLNRRNVYKDKLNNISAIINNE